MSKLACLLAFALALAACENGKPAESPEQPYETFNEDEYNNVQSPGEGMESSSGYYGTGSSDAPARTPASPSGGHQPH